MFFRSDFDFSLFDLKPGSKKETDVINMLRKRANYIELYEVVMAMFDYKNLPFRKEFIEELLIMWGNGAIMRDNNGELHVGYLSYNDLDENGLPIGKATVTTRHGEQYDGVIDKEICLFYNNDVRLPELKLELYADMFSEADKSIKSIIKKARLLPIPMARDSKVKEALNQALDDIDRGNVKALGYEAIADDFAGEGDPVTMLHLTEPEHTDKLQYMSKFYDDMLRRVLTWYGHPLSSASKMAQVTSAELEGYSTYSRIYPDVMLKQRRDNWEHANEIWGTNVEVNYSRAWEHLNNDIVLNNELEGANDEIITDVENISDERSDVDSVG